MFNFFVFSKLREILEFKKLAKSTKIGGFWLVLLPKMAMDGSEKVVYSNYKGKTRALKKITPPPLRKFR